MAIYAKQTQKEYTLHPEGGPYPAVVSKVGLHEGVETSFGIKDRLQITFQTNLKARDHVDGIDDDRPMTISMFVNNTLNKGSRLLELVSQQISRERLAEMLADSGGEIDIEGLLLGSQWLLTVEHVESNGKTYANITSHMRATADQRLKVWDEEGLPF